MRCSPLTVSPGVIGIERERFETPILGPLEVGLWVGGGRSAGENLIANTVRAWALLGSIASAWSQR